MELFTNCEQTETSETFTVTDGSLKMTGLGCAGVKFLNRFLSSRLLVTPKEVYHPLYDFLKSLAYPGEGDLMLNSQMEDYRDLPPALSHAERFLEECKETVCLSPFPPIDGLAIGPLSVHSAPGSYASGTSFNVILPTPASPLLYFSESNAVLQVICHMPSAMRLNAPTK